MFKAQSFLYLAGIFRSFLDRLVLLFGGPGARHYRTSPRLSLAELDRSMREAFEEPLTAALDDPLPSGYFESWRTPMPLATTCEVDLTPTRTSRSCWTHMRTRPEWGWSIWDAIDSVCDEEPLGYAVDHKFRELDYNLGIGPKPPWLDKKDWMW